MKSNSDGLLEDYLNKQRVSQHKKTSRKKGSRKSQIRSTKVRLGENPFKFVLNRISELKVFDLHNSDFIRYGHQPNYANWHGIDPDLLIGFLHQSVNKKLLSEKVNPEGPKTLEPWFKVKQSFPLAVISFVSSAYNLEGYPIEIGLAIAHSQNSKVEVWSRRLKPSPEWVKRGKIWDRERQKLHEILSDDLAVYETTQEIIEHITEITLKIPVLYCDDMRIGSYLYDLIIDKCKIPPDFVMQDVGVFLDHDASKRSHLREMLQQPPATYRAGAYAERLCRALRHLAA